MEPYYIKISSWMQQYAIKHKATIIRIFLLLEIALILFIAAIVVVAITQTPFPLVLYEVGKKLGTVSAGLLCLVVLPGIFKRLRWFQTIRIMLTLFRRHLGILMYWTALAHGLSMFNVLVLLIFAYGYSWSKPFPFDLFIVFGFLATTLALPLLITSNDFSVRLLKRWWNVLHKLVYLVLLFGALHTLTTSFFTGLVLLGLVSAEVISYTYEYITHHSARR